MKTVRNESEFLKMIDADDRADAEHSLYKYTSCGAWISFQEPGVVRSKKKVRWTARLRLSILGVLVLSARKAHGRRIVDVERLPAEVVEYLCLDLKAANKALRHVVQIGDEMPSEFFKGLKGVVASMGQKVISFEIDGTRKFRGGITIGSIVEGTDAEATPVELEYPFTEEEYNKAVEVVEWEADRIWNETHGCEDCGIPSRFGGNEVNPDCKTCHGEGTIL